MNKNATRKLFSDANKDSVLLKLLLVFHLSVSSLSAQIPINGFCKADILFEGFKENSAFIPDMIIPADLDRNGSNEFMLLKNNNNLFAIVSNNKHRFSNTVVGPLNNLDIYNLTKNANIYCWLSRKNREVGLVTISKNGILSRKKIKKFDDIPSNITCVDLNNDGKKEMVVSGYSFEGLTLIKNKANRYTFSQITDNRVFPQIAHADFDYDGFTDIVAYDIFSNQLVFFYNKQELIFSESRKIALPDYPQILVASDVNSDGFTDLLISYRNKFHIFIGDTVSSFHNTIDLELKEKADDLSIADFNEDGINDILFANYSEGKLYLMFSKSGFDFYEPLLIYKDKDLIDVAAYKENGFNKIALLLRNGKIVVLSTVKKFEDYNLINFGSGVSSLGILSEDKINPEAYFFIDKNTNHLILLTLNKRSIPNTLYRFPLQNSYSVIKSIKRKNKIDFYFYNPNTSLIEILRLDSFKPTRRILYTKGKIKDLLLFNDRLKDRQRIYTLTESKSKLLLETYDYRDFRFVHAGSDSAGSNVLATALVYETYPSVYSLINKNDNLLLVKKEIKRLAAKEDSVELGTYNLSDFSKISLKCYNDRESNELIKVIILTERKNTKLIILKDEKIFKYELKEIQPEESTFQFVKTRNRFEIIFIDALTKKLKKIVLKENYKSGRTDTVLDSETVNNYISKPFKNNTDLILYAPGSDNNIIKLRIIR
ncbi:FG-GAP repeat domain-containing protein [Melioribacter sp. OK-6-Me]|uniref:FG-GAP repeat domain-containing protein n=1 Tax=unclassified Melioribacter TaxID=2627329 RepID=UPI003ED93141